MTALWLAIRLGAGRLLGWLGAAVGWIMADARRWLAALAVIAALVAVWQYRRAEHWQAATKAERAARAEDNRICRATADRLQAAIAADNAEDAARAQSYRNARQADAVARREAAEAYRATQGAIDGLRATVGQNQAGECATPDEVREALR